MPGRIACCSAPNSRPPATKALHTICGNNTSIVSSSWWWAYKCPKHVEQIISAINHSVASSWFSSLRLYYDARTNIHQINSGTFFPLRKLRLFYKCCLISLAVSDLLLGLCYSSIYTPKFIWKYSNAWVRTWFISLLCFNLRICNNLKPYVWRGMVDVMNRKGFWRWCGLIVEFVLINSRNHEKCPPNYVPGVIRNKYLPNIILAGFQLSKIDPFLGAFTKMRKEIIH
jgi:hypothetical protein